MKQSAYLLISVILFGTAEFANGQSKTNDIGIEGGPGLSIIHAKTGMYSHSRFSMGGLSGVFYQYNFNKIFSLKTAITYERKGTRLENKSDQIPAGDLIYHFDYLSLPLLFKVSAGQKIKFFANAGPCFSYLLNQSMYSKSKNGKTYKLGNNPNTYKSYDLGILLGIGMSMPVSDRFLISIEIRDNFGLISIRDDYNQPDAFGYFESDSGPKFKSYANSTTFIIGFTYRFKNRK